MDLKSIEKLMSEAKLYKEHGQFEDALANLHQVVNRCPDEPKYKYLLASTYFEAENDEAAKVYAQELIDENKTIKESLDLLGLIHFKEKKYPESETYFKQALAIDPEFHNARMNLIKLYFEAKDYIGIEENAKYILSHRDINRNTWSAREKYKILFSWYIPVISALIHALAKQAKYKEAIIYTEDMIQFYQSSLKRPKIEESIGEFGNIYKFYYLMGDKQKMEECKENIKGIFSERLVGVDKLFPSWEELADQGVF